MRESGKTMKWVRFVLAAVLVLVIGLYFGAYAWLRVERGQVYRIVGMRGVSARTGKPFRPWVEITLPPNSNGKAIFRLFRPLLWLESKVTGKDVYLVTPNTPEE